MKNIKWYKIIPIVINLYIIISTLVIVIIGISNSGGSFFRLYTVDSNIFLALCSIPLLFYEIKDYTNDEAKLPRWTVILYFVGAVVISITFLVVIFFLTPTLARNGGNVANLYTNGNTFFHVINPIMGIIMYIAILDEHPLGIKHCFLPFIPFGIYATIYISCVLSKVWDDFYGFTFNGKYEMAPLIIILLLIVCFLVALLLNRIHNRLVFAHNRVPII